VVGHTAWILGVLRPTLKAKVHPTFTGYIFAAFSLVDEGPTSWTLPIAQISQLFALRILLTLPFMSHLQTEMTVRC
jgi:hypothetical protein